MPRPFALLCLLHVVLLLSCGRDADPTPTAGAADSPVNVSLPRPHLGFAISLHHTTELHVYLDAVDELRGLGFDAVNVVTPIFQKDGSSTVIQRDAQRGPSREQVEALLRHAKSRGMHVTLMPIVLFTEPRGREWRGKLDPTDWRAWWSSYRAMLLDFADLAAACEVDVLSVGSELLSTEKRRSEWVSLIEAVRERYAGRLTYSTNWDSYSKPTFWDQLDMIGVNAYWDLTRSAGEGEATDAHLIEQWLGIQQRLRDFAVDVGRPVVFTEVGYPSLPWAVKDPWNYVGSRDQPADHDAQRRGYAAFLAAWSSVLGRPIETGTLRGHGFGGPRIDEAMLTVDGVNLLYGCHFYAWDPHVKQPGTTRDTGYGVRGKPAYELLEAWLGDK